MLEFAPDAQSHYGKFYPLSNCTFSIKFSGFFCTANDMNFVAEFSQHRNHLCDRGLPGTHHYRIGRQNMPLPFKLDVQALVINLFVDNTTQCLHATFLKRTFVIHPVVLPGPLPTLPGRR